MSPGMQVGPGVLRFSVLQALEKAQQRVARGSPSLHAALHYLRLTDRAWAEVDRAIDDVRFEPGPAPFAWTRLQPERGESSALRELRTTLQSARENQWLPWDDPGGLSRAECVALLACAIERTRALPAVSAGPLFHHLPVTRER